MHIELVGHCVEITQELRHYVSQKFTELARWVEQIKIVHLTLKLNQGKYSAEATVQINDDVLHIAAEHTDLYTAIDLLIDKMMPKEQKQPAD